MTTTGLRPTWEHRLNNAVRWGLRHWLLFANGLVLLYGGLPWLSPLARSAGFDGLGRLLFAIYTPLCHQLPSRAFFVNGYQVAFCQREVAMYTALFAGGLLFPLFRKQLRPLPLWFGMLLLLPMVLDGGTHLVDDLLRLGWRSDDVVGSFNFWARMLTGLLFAIAVLLTVYPRLERDLRQAQQMVSV